MKKPKRATKRTRKPPPTTGDVAGWLENRYHIMELFYVENEEAIAKLFAEQVQKSIEDYILGNHTKKDANAVYAEALSEIEKLFKKFLEEQKLDGVEPGVPTKASLMGVNARLKIKRGSPRPSFISSGLFEASFKAWAEGNL